MTCRTITYTPTVPTEALSIHMRSDQDTTQTQILFSSTYRALLSELGKILKRHENKKDTFSLKLLEQGKKIELFISTSPEKPSLQSFMAHIDELRSLLPNPFGNEFAWDLFNLINVLPIPSSSSHQRRRVMAHQVGVTTLVKSKREPIFERSRNREEILSTCDSLMETVALKRKRWEQARFATELGKIVLRHRDKKDTLSQRLFTQGGKFKIFSGKTSENPSNETFFTHVEELRTLLRNPFGEMTLKDPLLVGDLVWEKADFIAYCHALSFFVSEPIVSVEHLFASEILALINTLPILAQNQVQGVVMNQLGVITLALGKQELVPIHPTSKQHALEIVGKYQSLMGGVAREREQGQVNQFLTAEIDLCATEIDRRDAVSESTIATLSSSLDQVITEVRDRVETLTQERQYEMKITTAQLDRTEKSLEESQEALATAKVEIENLKVAYHNLGAAYSHLAGRCSWLEDKYNNDSSCSVM